MSLKKYASIAIKYVVNMKNTNSNPMTHIALACALYWVADMLPTAHAQTRNAGAAASTPDPRNLQVVAANAVTANRNQRIALVIGNAAYKEAPLLNPVNDAHAISKALQESGFTVILRENTDQRGMMSALREFGDKLRAGGVGVFYYAGHGMQIKGRNYLIPVGANVEREDEVAYSAVDAQAVLDKMEAAGNASNIMILDACRNNPFTRNTRSGQAGLAQMDAPLGTLVAFATSPGAVASDGTGSNGLYTQHLLDAMRKPGLKVEDVFKQVRANVRRDSQGKQVPWEATSLEGDFYFKPGAVGGEQSTAARPVATEAQIEMALWDAVKNSTLPIELRAYLNRYPEGRFAEEARGKVAALQRPAALAIAPITPPARPAVAPTLTPAPTPAPAVAAAATKFRWDAIAGDNWDFINEDVLTGKREEFKQTVDRVAANGDVSVNNGNLIYTAFGETRYVRNMSNGVATRERSYSGNLKAVPSELRVGFKEPMAYTIDNSFPDGRKYRLEGKGFIEAIGRERVDTPAGAMIAWKIKRETIANVEGADYKVDATFWYAPELKQVVAQEFTETNLKSGRVTQQERRTLKAFRLANPNAQLAAESNIRWAGGHAVAANFMLDTQPQDDLQASLEKLTNELLKELWAAAAVPSISPAIATTSTKPSSTAITNNFGFTVGDRWRYQVVDSFKGEVIYNYSNQITALQNGEIILNNGSRRWDDRGNERFATLASNETVLYSKSNVDMPATLEVGSKTAIAFEREITPKQGQLRKETAKGEMVVKSREKIKTPAGEFNAWRVERAVFYQRTDGASWRIAFTGWYVPELRNYVAYEEESRNSDGTFNRRERHELTSYSVRGADEALAKR